MAKVRKKTGARKGPVHTRRESAAPLLAACLRAGVKRQAGSGFEVYLRPTLLAATKEYKALAAAPGDVQAAAVAGAVTVAVQQSRSAKGWAAEKLLGLLLRRSIALDERVVISVLKLVGKPGCGTAPAALVGFLERRSGGCPISPGVKAAVKRLHDSLDDALERKEKRRLTELMRMMEAAPPTASPKSATAAPRSADAVSRGREAFQEFRAGLEGRRLYYEELKGSPEAAALMKLGRDELVGVALAAMEDFAQIADATADSEHRGMNVHFEKRYRGGVAALLSWLLRRELPYTTADFEHLAELAAKFTYLSELGCPHWTAFPIAVERFAAKNTVSPALAASLGRIEEAYRCSGRAAEGRQAARIMAVLRATQNRGSVLAVAGLNQLLLRRESVRVSEKPGLAAQLAEAMVLPAEGETEGAAAFPPDVLPDDAPVLAEINAMLARMRAVYSDQPTDGDLAALVKLASRRGLRTVAIVAAALSAMSRRQIKFGFGNRRAERFHNGAHALMMLVPHLLHEVKDNEAESLGEVCDALSRTGEFEFLDHQWQEITRSVAARVRALAAPDKGVLLRVLRLRERVARAADPTSRSALMEFDEAIGIGAGFPMELGERWSDRVSTDIAAMSAKARAAWGRFLAVCADASSSQPTARWLGRADACVKDIGRAEAERTLAEWLPLVGKARPIFGGGRIEGRDSSVPSECGAEVLRGMAWSAARFDTPRMAQALGDLAMACYKMVPGVGARCIKPGTASVWALSRMKGRHALSQLSRARQLVKFGTARKTLDATLTRLARDLNVSTDELHEIAAPDFGLSREATLHEEAGQFTLELRVDQDGPRVRILEGAAERKTVPHTVKREHGDALKALRATATDIEKMLPAQKSRLERLYHDGREIGVPAWRERYIDHPLVGTLARRLIWTVNDGAAGRAAMWTERGFVDERGRPVEIAESATVRLWHPVLAEPERVGRWRGFLEERRVRQPFKQAHREAYPLTDAERGTRTYSNRFAAHIIRQSQLTALCRQRGWDLKMYVLEYGEGPALDVPRHGLCAHYFVQGIGDESYGTAGAFAYLQTDQVRFSRGRDGPVVPLDEVPPLVFSEVMRDVDLFVALCSVGNNPQWQDGGPEGRFRDYWWQYGFGDLTGSGIGRREVLQRLIPRLKIAAACSVGEKFLRVAGQLRTYKIHFGSGNILMEPNDEYLCIVPGVGQRAEDAVFLPFEGDGVLSIILSKAFMLAEDANIKDQSIMRQIRRD